MSIYEEMYTKLFNATEDAINILIRAQRECEEIYLSRTYGGKEKEETEEE